MKNPHPLISIIIPAYNCEETIVRCVASILHLTWGNKEIIIIDDGSTDATPDILKGYGGDIRIIRTPNAGPSRARNIGVREATGEFIAFTDSDCIVAEDWLDELFKGFVSEKTAGVGGDQQSPADDTPFGKNIHAFMKSVGFVADYLKIQDRLIRTRHNPTCNVMYRREVLLEAGLFDEALWPGEDVDIDLKITRLGYELYYNPGAVVWHYRAKDAGAFSRMMRRYGWAQAYLVRKYGLFRLIHYVPFFTAALVGGLIALAIIKTVLFVGLSILALFFITLIFTLKTKSLKLGAYFLFLFFILLYNWNLGFAKGIISGVR
ncbi:MAG: glycosyltransferase [Candidatus Sumerlaeota bacterium]|nr:glycosyltransferase [Candidatus Sumerlaeota bacterium]